MALNSDILGCELGEEMISSSSTESIIERLPLEIAGEIFVHCLQDHFVRPERSNAPISVCGVSRYWRSLALSTPALWSSISVVLKHGLLATNLSLMRLWIQRSVDRPLTLELKVDESEFVLFKEQRMHNISEIFRIFLPTYKRWKEVRFDLSRRAHIALLQLPEDGLPLLESLDINLDIHGVTNPNHPESLDTFPDHLLNVLHKSSKLRDLTWKARSVKPLPPFAAFSQTLTTLSLNSQLSIYECLRILTSFKELLSCALYNVSENHPDSSILVPPTAALKHAKLESLHTEASTAVSILFRSLTLPSLKTLTVTYTVAEPHQGHSSAAELSRMIKRSSPPLEKLILENMPLVEEDLIELLRSLNSLVILDLHDEGYPRARYTERTIMALGRDGVPISSSMIYPQLEALKLRERNIGSAEGKVPVTSGAHPETVALGSSASCTKVVYVNFGVGPFEPFRITHPMPIDARLLQKLKDSGMNVQVVAIGC